MALEDFETYSVVDTQTVLTIATNTITWTNIKDLDLYQTHVYKDYGIGHFGDFEHLISYDHTSTTPRSYVTIWVLANNIGQPSPLWTTSLLLRSMVGTSLDYVQIMETEGGALGDSDFYSGDFTGVRMYHTIARTGTTCTCKIYSDAERTVQLDILTFTCHTTTLRYVYGFANWEAGDDRLSDGHVYNLDLQEVVAVPPMGLGLKMGMKGGTGRPPLGTGGASFGG